MRKFIFALMAAVLSCSSVSAFWQEAAESSLEFGVGYRRDNIEFKREFGGCDSSSSDCYSSSSYSSNDSGKSKSKLKLKDLDIWLIEGRGKYVTCDNIYLRGSVDYGWITSGKIKNTFEFEGERESFNASFDSNGHHIKGNVWDGKIALGYQFKWCDEAMTLSPVIGYGWNGHEFRNGNHDDYSSSSYDYSSCSSYLYSSDSSNYYSSGDHHKITQRWVGPFIGIDLEYRVCCDWNLFAGYEYHWADYHAKQKHADGFDFRGNTCDDSDIHIHGSDAWGNVFNIGVKWDLCDCWTVGLRGEFQWWEAHNARERRKLCSDSRCGTGIDVVMKTKVKDITWNSSSIVLDLGMVF